METDVVDKLKASGNEAFKQGKLDEALTFYEKAIKTQESLSKDFSKLAILHSNSAQVYLEQKKFDQAISAASTSLEHDPGFKKSLLRRGIAHVESNKHEEATDDLRSFLRMEPKNQQAVNYLRRVFPFAKLSDALRKSFIGHYLRRELIKWPPMLIKHHCDPSFVKYLLRSTGISLGSSRVMKEFWKDGRIGSVVQEIYEVLLSPWFAIKRKKADILQESLSITLSNLMTMFIIQVVRPTGLFLELDDSFSAFKLSSFYKFEQIYCVANFLCNDIAPDQTPIKNFNYVSKFLTGLAYFDGIPSVPIPNLKVLIVLPDRNVSSKFVKDWAKFKWPIKRIEIRGASSDLSSFENFKGVLSHDVTGLRILFGQSGNDASGINLIQRLSILKRCFPNLKNLIVDLEITLVFNNGASFSDLDSLKPYLKFLMTVIDAKKVDWCNEPKVCVKIFSQGETGSNVLKNMKFIEKMVKECRSEMKELTFIRVTGPSMNKLGRITDMCAYSRIEMEANGIWFDFSFHTCDSFKL